MCDDEETKDKVSESMSILTVAVRHEGESEADLGKKFYDFCQERRDQLKKRRIRRITFLVLDEGKFPQYYSFR